MMKDTVQYFADLELLSHVNGVKHPASPRSVLCVAAEKDVLAFSEAGHLQSCGAFCTLLMLYKRSCDSPQGSQQHTHGQGSSNLDGNQRGSAPHQKVTF